jgi:8-oxo-dGTP pyrophosphatase MutT (NUDIX family)
MNEEQSQFPYCSNEYYHQQYPNESKFTFSEILAKSYASAFIFLTKHVSVNDFDNQKEKTSGYFELDENPINDYNGNQVKTFVLCVVEKLSVLPNEKKPDMSTIIDDPNQFNISIIGGKRKMVDKDCFETAIREFEEETLVTIRNQGEFAKLLKTNSTKIYLSEQGRSVFIFFHLHADLFKDFSDLVDLTHLHAFQHTQLTYLFKEKRMSFEKTSTRNLIWLDANIFANHTNLFKSTLKFDSNAKYTLPVYKSIMYKGETFSVSFRNIFTNSLCTNKFFFTTYDKFFKNVKTFTLTKK